MLSSVLNSERAIQVNIRIMRIFVRLKEMIISNKTLALKIKELEEKVGKHDDKINFIFKAIGQLINEEEKPRKTIGFHVNENKQIVKLNSGHK